MAFNKKYAGLPDLDLAPDLYETPDLTDETTAPTATVRTISNADDSGSDSDIDREHVNADEARAHFLGATVDARHVNFSDSIASKRKSYRSKSRRRRRDFAEGEYSDSEDESLERKLARLQREVEELKDEMAAQKPDAESNGAPDATKNTLDDGVEQLSQALDNLYASSRGASQPHSAAAVVSQKLASDPSSTHVTGASNQAKSAIKDSETESTASVSAGILSHAAAFDTRLALIESAMGISTSSNPFISDGSSEPPLQPVLPALDHLTSRLSTLTTLLVGPSPVPAMPTTGSAQTTAPVTTPHLEILSARVRKLTADAEALASARKRAIEAGRAVQSSRLTRTASISSTTPGGELEATAAQRDEQATKIQALYATLPTIQSLHPLLPSVLERLRSLRAIHAGAAQASESLDELEKRQAEMAGEIEQWRQGLKTVEEKMSHGEAALKNNIELVEPWVRDLEKRLEKLEADD
ncbi:Dynamitin-domain-containing protein [Aspergillus egyptiacus]|nr:Dynamitin-domain-containing protein [Aspergillus egyptiacus]